MIAMRVMRDPRLSASAYSREDIIGGAQDLAVDLDQHIEFCIEAMKQRAAELGLAGTQPAGAAS